MNINISCPINQTGYGVASINIVKNLYKNNSISYFPIGQPLIQNKEDHAMILEMHRNSFMLDANAPFIKIWHQFDLSQRIGRGKYYAFPFFELDTFNSQEILHLNIPDSIFVTSNWAKQIIIDNNISTEIHVIPLGVDRTIFDHRLSTLKNSDKYIFLNIGKWEVRKGHDILLELFMKAFPNEKDVELHICASEKTNSYSTAEDLIRWKKMYSMPRIKLLSGVDTHKDIANLISNSDCGIYPSRAEGWNLELLECMSMNKPVIATNYSAHTEFCNADNSFLVDIEQKEKAYDGKAFNNQGNWAKIDKKQKDQIIDYMRYVYKNRITTNSHGVKTAEKYNWTNTASIIERCISS